MKGIKLKGPIMSYFTGVNKSYSIFPSIVKPSSLMWISMPLDEKILSPIFILNLSL